MSSEPAEVRRKKRIVEYVISGFPSANKAIVFGNTINSMVTESTGKQKYQQYIASPDTKLAITDKWNGLTTLKANFLELKSQHISVFITEAVRRAVRNHNELYPDKIKIEQEIVRIKPQPQFIAAAYIPRTTTVNKIG